MNLDSLLGALVGDAAGATLEFYDDKITEEMALDAMKMPGGGELRVGPGQITDDGELILTLWQALNSFETSDTVPILTLMRGYMNWYESCPFDMGRTCSLAFEVFSDFFRGQNVKNIKSCKEMIIKLNEQSEANGALMRATAIATWIANNPSFDLSIGIECAKEDARLSHPSIVCQEVNAIYVFAIILLLRGISPDEVLFMTTDFVSSSITSDKVKNWYFNESLDINTIHVENHIGHIRWGFILAIYFLRHPEISYEEAIKITLMKGGDTDTNAAIVGGIVGAYQVIPEYMLHPILEFDCTDMNNRGYIRPKEYSVKRVISHLI